MGRVAFFFLAFALVSPYVHAEEPADAVDNILKNGCAKNATVAMFVKSLGTNTVIYSKNGSKLMIPASNMKIATSAAALDLLGPTFTFDTKVSYTGERAGDEIKGDLVITGSGDPHLVTEDLFLMANEIRKRGIKRIKGNLALDGGYFDSSPFPDGWKISSYRRAFEAPLNALSLNFNSFAILVYPTGGDSGKVVATLDPETPYLTLQNRIRLSPERNHLQIEYRKRSGGSENIIISGSVKRGAKEKTFYRSISDPLMYFGMTFVEMLKKNGVVLEGDIVRSHALQSQELFVHSSWPLYQLLAYMNKFSNNFMAEQILRTLAAETVSVPGTEKDGIRKIEEYLRSLGYSDESFRVMDGSGFSRDNRLSASLIVKLLEREYRRWKNGPEFLTSLALMGLDGSVQDRLKDTNRTIRVKTGTLSSISALSGFYPTDYGDILIFSIIFNDWQCANDEAMRIQHRILREFNRIK
jgi:D-alanyl-D-alanine carboxypeptidase/D-alanyl-D-alanine-endopeptidase (penicillin-binding protein 4)